ncbi:MAG: precorrin-6y C5,15-methyltransferase (decarboxylating), CbiE subunit/precorrin-6Y [Oscillospiraceae bacterium]|nr:precorrin-6y C5,15-methyltransferase (decarboxylating), CbiE subunit/precorrin-6Y [Oscillospiraceae bacterium]
MRVTILGVGMGNPETLTLGGLRALERADAVIGASRLLASLPSSCGADRLTAITPSEIRSLLEEHSHWREAAVVMSGDIGFYSGTTALLPALEGYEVETICGITTVQYLAAKLRRPWQDVRLVSAHGIDCNIIGSVLSAREVFFLTGGKITPSTILHVLCSSGLGLSEVTVGANLSYPDEWIVTDTANALREESFPPLSSVWVRRSDPLRQELFCPGLPDDAFIRADVPMTKQEVRACVLAKLRVETEDVVYDIGAGTGSVGVELALLSPMSSVFAVECAPEACGLIRANREAFCALNLTLVEGTAPEALSPLPPPQCAFIGGSRGRLEPILSALLLKNPGVRVVISAIAVETLGEALTDLKKLAFSGIEITQLAVSRSKPVGTYHLMTGQNPIFLLSAQGGERP